MKISVSQRITKGISSLNVKNCLRWLSSNYESTGRTRKSVWKKVLKVDTKTKHSFKGSSVYKLEQVASMYCLARRNGIMTYIVGSLND